MSGKENFNQTHSLEEGRCVELTSFSRVEHDATLNELTPLIMHSRQTFFARYPRETSTLFGISAALFSFSVFLTAGLAFALIIHQLTEHDGSGQKSTFVEAFGAVLILGAAISLFFGRAVTQCVKEELDNENTEKTIVSMSIKTNKR